MYTFFSEMKVKALFFFSPILWVNLVAAPQDIYP